MIAPVVVVCAQQSRFPEARAVATELGLPLMSAGPIDSVILGLDEKGWFLRHKELGGAVRVDFIGGAMGYRRQRGVGRRQPLAKAAGITVDFRPHVWDLTAGLGRDAFVLALLGCRVDMVERSPVIATLLADGLARARQSPELAGVVARMRLHRGDAMTMLAGAHEQPDVIYLDPMYPGRDKSALVKKEMRLLRTVVGDDDDAAELLEAARQRARRRVVVKRPRLAPAIAGPAPSYTLPGKTTRFDVYLLDVDNA